MPSRKAAPASSAIANKAVRAAGTPPDMAVKAWVWPKIRCAFFSTTRSARCWRAT